MSKHYLPLLHDALEYLLQLHEDGALPRDALSRLHALQERHPGMEIDLAWHEEALARSFDYSALLRLPGQGTLSLGWCSERAVPWPLRGAYHSREEEILRVNQWRLTLLDVMTFLDFIWKDTALIRQLVDQALIATEVARRALQPAEADLERAMDGFRRERGLLTVTATLQWLEERGITQALLEEKLAEGLRQDLLREEIASGGVEDYFARHRKEFDTVTVARLWLPSEGEARETFGSIRDGELAFIEAAREAYLAGGPRTGCTLFARIRRPDLPSAQAETLFRLRPGDVAPPAPAGGGFEILQVLRVEPARLDEVTRERIKDRLFAAWLEERRAEAEIEWFWGEVPATSPS